MGIIHSCTSDKTIKDLNKLKTLIQNMKAKTASYILLFLIVITVFVFWKQIPKEGGSSVDKKIAAELRKLAGSRSDVINSATNEQKKNEKMKNFHIASSYNTCRGSPGLEDVVSLESLKHALKMGARVLDFEIYSVNNAPVVSVSDDKSFRIKGTMNTLSINQVLRHAKTTAFSSGEVENHLDPLFLNFRMKTTREDIYAMLLTQIHTILGDKLLYRVGSKYKFYTNEENVLNATLEELEGKIIIIINTPELPSDAAAGMRADGSNAHHMDEKINMSDKHAKHFIYRFSKIKNMHGPDRFKEDNKENYCMVYPDLANSKKNLNYNIPFSYGCQMVFMNYSKKDDFLDSYMKKFDRSSFKLKREDLRFVPVTFEEPPDQDPNLSYGAGDASNFTDGNPAAVAILGDASRHAI